jgi:hypothetical protein
MAKWIWLKEGQSVDSHAEFFIPLTFSGEKTEIRLSADSDYTLYVNGKFVSCNQYRDYPYDDSIGFDDSENPNLAPDGYVG